MTRTKRTATKTAKKNDRPKTPQNKERCFVISPFGGWFDSYFSSIFEPAILAANLQACRADDLYRPSSIIHDIWAYVSGAKVLLADLTGKNANVLYELGLAHATGKPVVMVTQNLDDVPFDLRNLRVITYDLRDPAWAELLSESITHSLKEVLESPESAVPPAFLKERKAVGSPEVSPIDKRLLDLTQQVESLRRSQRRLSLQTNEINSPNEARSLMRRYLEAGMSPSMIVERLDGRGVPERWIRDELKTLMTQRTIPVESDPDLPI